MNPRAFLHWRGWEQLNTTNAGNGMVVTWWRKLGREFPQHFALWLERTGAVKLLSC